MSAYSTVRITRSKARQMALGHIHLANDELLEQVMDFILRQRLYNCRIVPDGAENDEEEIGV